MKRKFYKYQGAGNDFIVVDARQQPLNLTREQVATLCDRRLAIGADGFMALEPDPAGAEFFMRYYNADGGEAAMCGNGGRCLALFAHHLGIGGRLKTFHSPDGMHTAEITETAGAKGRVRLQMIDVRGYDVYGKGLFLNTGVPHYVEFVQELDRVDVSARGGEIRYARQFVPQGGTNVNFVQRLPDGNLRIRTYERGVEGETLACGTGATAAAIAANVLYEPERNDFTVQAPGGDLRVVFEVCANRLFKQVYLEGPAAKVFECELNLDEIFGG